MGIQEIGWRVDSIDLAQDRDRWQCVVTAVMNIRVPSNAGNFLTSPGTVTFSRRAMPHGVIFPYLMASHFCFPSLESL